MIRTSLQRDELLNLAHQAVINRNFKIALRLGESALREFTLRPRLAQEEQAQWQKLIGLLECMVREADDGETSTGIVRALAAAHALAVHDAKEGAP